MAQLEGEDVFAARRAAFGKYAATYHAVRPDWPAETIGWMLGSPTTATVCRVVDLGAGTGLGTRTLAEMGHQVLAVEPSDGMRGVLTTSLSSLPANVAARISAVAGGAEEIPAGTGSVDAVTVFQAWHWFDETAAFAECARVIRAGGWLSMAWHHRSDDLAWSQELSDIVEHDENMPDGNETVPAGPEFDPVQTGCFTHILRQNVEELVLHASTWSFVAIHPERDRMLQDVRALGRRVADAYGMVEIPMTTNCYRLRRH